MSVVCQTLLLKKWYKVYIPATPNWKSVTRSWRERGKDLLYNVVFFYRLLIFDDLFRYALVHFESAEEATRVMKASENVNVNGEKLTVKFHKWNCASGERKYLAFSPSFLKYIWKYTSAFSVARHPKNSQESCDMEVTENRVEGVES
jgi:hypothetical protein